MTIASSGKLDYAGAAQPAGMPLLLWLNWQLQVHFLNDVPLVIWPAIGTIHPAGIWRICSHFMNRRRAMRRAMRAPVHLAPASIWDAATKYSGVG